MRCPSCSDNCNAGRDCPVRPRTPVWRPPVWLYVAATALWGLIIWAVM